jgi:hypothetical protein
MDVDVKAVLKFAKENVISMLIVAVCAVIAVKEFNQKQAAIGLLKQSDELEMKKNEVLVELRGLEKSFQGLKEKVNNKAIVSVIYSLSTLAKNADVKIVTIKPVVEQAFSAYTRYPFELSVSAPDYHTFGKFISKLENAPEFFFIEHLEVTMGSDQINVKMLVSTVLIQ